MTSGTVSCSGSLTPKAGTCRRACAGPQSCQQIPDMHDQPTFPSDTWGPNVGPSKPRVCCGFRVAGASCSSASAGTPPPGRGNPLCHLSVGSSACPEPGAVSARGTAWETNWFPVPASPPAAPRRAGARQWTRGPGCARRLLTEDEARPQTGASPWAHSHQREPMCA